MSRRKKTLAQESVELNLAAMLDMAFQLLTFFILTFRPAPIEGEIALKMPQAVPRQTAPDAKIGSQQSSDPIPGLESLTISVEADSQGGIASLAVEEENLTLGRLDARLRTLLAHPDSALKQIVIQADSGLRYDALMNVVDTCARQKLSGGHPLKRLSFVVLPRT